LRAALWAKLALVNDERRAGWRQREAQRAGGAAAKGEGRLDSRVTARAAARGGYAARRGGLGRGAASPSGGGAKGRRGRAGEVGNRERTSVLLAFREASQARRLVGLWARNPRVRQSDG
jgi:hypothetical protein